MKYPRHWLDYKILLVLVFIFGLGVFGIWLVVNLFLTHFEEPVVVDMERWGQTGDFFGGMLNPLFSFLAFIGLLATIGIQATASKRQQIQSERQAFESRFFHLLANLHKLHADIDNSNKSDVQARGSLALRFFNQQLRLVLGGLASSKGGWKYIDRNDLIDAGRTAKLLSNADPYRFADALVNLATYVDHADDTIDKTFFFDSLLLQIGIDERTFLIYTLAGFPADEEMLQVLGRAKLLHPAELEEKVDENLARFYETNLAIFGGRFPPRQSLDVDGT